MLTLSYPYLLALFFLPILPRLVFKMTQGATPMALPVPFFEKYERLQKELAPELPNKNYFNQIAYWLIWALIVLACARPIYLGPPLQRQQAGRNLMLAVDISGSMQIPDMVYQGHRVRRIDLVKEVAKDFIEKRAGDRIGLILFGTNAYLLSPLTFDRHTVRELLLDASVGLAGNRTAIGDAIGVAIKRLKDIPEKHRILILLTDGASNAGSILPNQAAKLAKDYGVKIYTIGLGTAQVTLSDMLGNPIVAGNTSELDEASLQEIASLTGGHFFRANNSTDLKKIYDRINTLEPIEQDHETIRLKQDVYFMPLLLAVLLSFLLAGRQVVWNRIVPLELRARLTS